MGCWDALVHLFTGHRRHSSTHPDEAKGAQLSPPHPSGRATAPPPNSATNTQHGPHTRGHCHRHNKVPPPAVQDEGVADVDDETVCEQPGRWMHRGVSSRHHGSSTHRCPRNDPGDVHSQWDQSAEVDKLDSVHVNKHSTDTGGSQQRRPSTEDTSTAALAATDPGDFYKVLGVTPTATASEIRASYKKLALRLHPDRPNGNEELFKRVSAAYEVLSNPDTRAVYDRRQAAQTSTPPWYQRAHHDARADYYPTHTYGTSSWQQSQAWDATESEFHFTDPFDIFRQFFDTDADDSPFHHHHRTAVVSPWSRARSFGGGTAGGPRAMMHMMAGSLLADMMSMRGGPRRAAAPRSDGVMDARTQHFHVANVKHSGRTTVTSQTTHTTSNGVRVTRHTVFYT